MSNLFQAGTYLKHWLDVVDEHSIHSPFFFDFYSKVVRAKPSADFDDMEKLRAHLLKNQTEVEVEDFGAGSKILKSKKRRLCDIARTSLSPPQFANLYHRICTYTEAERIIELGTSLGLTSLYLARTENSMVYTFEGSNSLANVALTNFEFLDAKNIELTEGNINDTFPEFLQSTEKIDFILLDANHRYAPTLQYFDWLMKRLDEKSVMVIDDIHYSPEMEKAWKELKHHDLVYGSIDLYRCGILFFDPALNKQHFVWSL